MMSVASGDVSLKLAGQIVVPQNMSCTAACRHMRVKLYLVCTSWSKLLHTDEASMGDQLIQWLLWPMRSWPKMAPLQYHVRLRN